MPASPTSAIRGPASNIQVREPIYRSSIARWRNYKRAIGPLRDALGDLAG
jgi:hypothetical protein